MHRRVMRNLAVAAVVATVALAISVSEAQAGWRWHHSGVSHGSWGSSGGSWGSHGGSWGGWRRHWGHHRHFGYYHSSGGSYGNWGSSGGSHGSCGSHGSSGGGWNAVPAPAQRPSGDAPTSLPAEESASLRGSGSGTLKLTVNVPAEAKIFINGKATTTAASPRRYISRGLMPGYRYTYKVRAELLRDGKTLDQTKVVQLRAGEDADMSFDFEVATTEEAEVEAVRTRLTVHVPDEAKVFLSGTRTSSTGPVRTFSTSKLSPGESWSNYTIRVALDRDGRTLAKERTISLKAGEDRVIAFDFDEPRVAATSTNPDR